MTFHEKYIAFGTILRKEIVRFTRIWVQSLLPPVITMFLYFIIFGKFIGSQISEIGGVSYMEFIVPGLVMMSVITNSYSNVVSSFFSTKFHHSVEELLISPTPNYVIILGYVSGGVARGILVGMLVSITSFVFVPLKLYNPAFVVLYVFLCAFLFSLAGFMNAIFAKKFDDITIIPTFVLTPLTYLGGVLYSISLLPEFWQGLSKVNPILYMVNGFRFGFLGMSDVNVFSGIAISLCFIAILFAANLYLLKRGVGLKD
ncbi:MAG: ABC transporter permease [Proteobacteria bacterium]|nr:ABC transporter permease [Pseudomonadota bacterium]